MKKYFGILALIDGLDGYKVTRRFEVECRDSQEAWEKVEKYKRDNKLPGVIFSIPSKESSILDYINDD